MNLDLSFTLKKSCAKELTMSLLLALTDGTMDEDTSNFPGITITEMPPLFWECPKFSPILISS